MCSGTDPVLGTITESINYRLSKSAAVHSHCRPQSDLLASFGGKAGGTLKLVARASIACLLEPFQIEIVAVRVLVALLLNHCLL